MTRPIPTLLLLLDGWGAGTPGKHNAVSQARTPELDRLMSLYPGTTLLCSGEAVGLPEGQMGNSEVGHLNIGAGRVVYQDIVRIDRSIRDGSFMANAVIRDLLGKVKAGGGRLHLMGLVSDGGVHSHQRHLLALLEMARRADVPALVHCFLDGRDTPPASGLGYVRDLIQAMATMGHGAVATVCGRYWAMDRDKRWDRVQQAFQALVDGQGTMVDDPLAAIAEAHAAGETDEFVRPRVVTGPDGRPLGRILDNDAVFFFNFRADRARELVRSLLPDAFDGFERSRSPRLAAMASMTEYDPTFGLPAAFPPQRLDNILAQVLSERGMRQLRIAETEKYAHVTYFFNGGREAPWPGEDRVLIPSPKEVATYDLKPEMSAFAVTDRLCHEWSSGDYDFIVCNLANLDMVGHTGVMAATIRACEVVDQCVGQVARTVLESGGRMLLSADHGNADAMLDGHGAVQTAHSMNPVPLAWIESSSPGRRLRTGGVLGDLAPTLLDLWSMPQPPEMTGRTLVEG